MDCERVTIGQSFEAGSKPPHVDIHILVVDDDATTLAIVSAMLRTMRYQVVTVRNPVDALTTLRMKKGLFDIVVTDLHMPYMNGFEFQKKVDEEFKLPVIMMSADDKESVILKGLKGGVAYFIVKPVSPDDLKNVWQYAVAAKKGKSVVIEEIDKSFHDESSSSADQKISSGDINSANEEKRGRKDCKRKAAKKSKKNQQNHQQHNSVAPKKAKVVWTNSLHNRFLLAIRHVTLEKAVPKRILEFMNVPGLTRENVASHLQKYRIFLKRVAEKGALAANKGSMSDKVFRSSFASGHSSLQVLKNMLQQQQQQMRITSPTIFQQGFRANNTSTPNSSNLGIFTTAITNTVPNHGLFGHSNLLGNQANIQHPILGGTTTNPVYQPNFPGFGLINSNINNGNTGFIINGANQQQNQAKTGPFITPSVLNQGLTSSPDYRTSRATKNSMGNFNANLVMSNSCYPSNNFAGIQRNSNGGGGLMGLDQSGLNVNGGGVTGELLFNNAYGLVNGVCSDNMNNSVGSLGNGNFESGIQALLFPNNIINHQQNALPQNHQSGFFSNHVNNGESDFGYKDGLITFNNTTTAASHAQQSSVENDISHLILMGDTNLQPPLFHQQQQDGGPNDVASNLCDISCETQVNPSANQVQSPDLSALYRAQENAPYQQSLGQNQGSEQVMNPEYGNSTLYPTEVYNPCSDQYTYQKQGSIEAVDCELRDMYQDWDDFMDSLLNAE